MSQNNFPGQELRERRKKLGISVYETFRHTRVPAEYIEALERSDLNSLPGECYTVGFLKTYCVFLGLNGERYVDSFRACSRAVVRSRFGRRRPAHVKAPAWINDAMTWAVITAIIILGWVTYTTVFRPQADITDQRVKAGTIDLVVPSTPDSNKE